jgi:sugar (pentulose or hexulose) kinase
MAGSSTCLNAVVAAPLDRLEVTHYPHVIGDDYTTETGINTTGAAVTWVADRLFGGRRNRASSADFERLNLEAAAVAPGANGLFFVPVLGHGERTDAGLRGAITGFVGHGGCDRRSAGASPSPSGRSWGCCRTAARPSRARLRCDARLATWNQVKADVTGLVVVAYPGDAATSGSGHAGGLGVRSTGTRPGDRSVGRPRPVLCP